MQKLAIAEVCERRLGNVVYDARVVEIKNRKGLRSRLLETNFDLLSKSFRKHALVYLDIDVPDAWMLFAQALLYLIYLFSHEAGDLVGIIGKKTLEFPEITSHLLKLLLHRATPVRLAQKCATIEFHLALDAIHAPAEHRRLEIDDLLDGRIGLKKRNDFLLHLLGYSAAQEIRAIFEDECDRGEGKKHGDGDRAECVPHEVLRQVRRCDRGGCYHNAENGHSIFEVYGQGYRIREFQTLQERCIGMSRAQRARGDAERIQLNEECEQQNCKDNDAEIDLLGMEERRDSLVGSDARANKKDTDRRKKRPEESLAAVAVLKCFVGLF